ncbi:orotidine-5'-phosphate decarboxylase [Prochlorococcus marinus]|uniref:Orotidine 5'-phosphate decarboxylase n=1 Tax=Prochlorococcus marinus XMU1408 TaxID=2213228 RepID=A0A318R2Y5_PROMR|nr:orotidine-5'-phosphate decarboxylase [Prochlorococcus marinus]MBW3042512.1 orotidine-5'-phosphate decarboxylase [Prochlorococcus marinus str. XMU1408]PYE01240.1 orotidine-5'-phosphate decarboxylase [Prochlorococcus marinus XMU1408]
MKNLENPSEKIIVALDGMNKNNVLNLLEKIPEIMWVKVGLELFVSEGPDVLSILRDKGKKIFLDLKFHDIPTTVERACFAAAQTGAQLISLHTCAGTKALKMANEAANEGAAKVNLTPPTLLGITILTSWTQESFISDLLIDHSINQRVRHLSEIALNSGLGGCVCSPREVQSLRKICPETFELVTPGIRALGSDFNDQSRVSDASEAIKMGASRLVIGRAITQSHDPAYMFKSFCEKVIV